MTCFVNICDHDKLLCLDAPLRKASYNLALICPQNAPHTQDVVTADEWDRPYSREAAAFPAVSTKLVSFLLPTSLPLKTDLTLAHTTRHAISSFVSCHATCLHHTCRAVTCHLLRRNLPVRILS